MVKPRVDDTVRTKLQRIAELAEQDKKIKFTSLAHLLTPGLLRESLLKLNQYGAAGVDDETVSDFKADLEVNIDKLWHELRSGKYRPRPVKRVYIPKEDGSQRPLGIPSVRDRIVQRAVSEIVSKIYEPYFCDCSYGFRPGRSCHDALETLRRQIDLSPIRFILDADIKAYFDEVNHNWLIEFLQHRIADKTLIKLIRKWLKSGIMEKGVVARSEEGTPQGGPLSPLLANIYLHYVLDLWFEHKVRPMMKGACALIRYADDFVVCFEHRAEAEQFQRHLEDRFAQFNLKLSAEKTKLIEFGRNSNHNGRCGPHAEARTFDFLGFTHYMRKRGKRGYRLARKPSRKSRNRFLKKAKKWLGDNRDRSEWYQAKRLKRMLQGYYNYFGLRHCKAALKHIKWNLERLWVTELRKRSQRHKLYWSRMKRYPWFKSLPSPKLR